MQGCIKKDKEWHSFEIDTDRLERVLVVPLEVRKSPLKTAGKRKQRGIFLLIFGYGDIIRETISPQSDFIVIWNENVGFGFPPFYAPDLEKISESEKSYSNRENVVRKSEKKLKTYSIHNRPISFEPIESIKLAIAHLGGMWKRIDTKNLNMELKNKHFKKYPLPKLLENNLAMPVTDILYWFKNSSFVLLRDVFNEKYQLKNYINPDPYSIVRSFLKFIGVYPPRQGGKNHRQRLSQEDEEAIITCLASKKPVKQVIVDAFNEQGLRSPTDYQISRIKELIVNRQSNHSAKESPLV